MTKSEINDLRARSEIAIQSILLNLEMRTGKEISEVWVDTHNFQTPNIEIVLEWTIGEQT